MPTSWRRLALASVLLAGGSGCAREPAPALWSGLTPGRSSVGFVTKRLEDPSRPLDGRPRPVQVTCWYAQPFANERARLTYRDYVALSAAERGPADDRAVDAVIGAYRGLFKDNRVDPALVDRWFESGIYAHRGHDPDLGDAPLVLIAQGNGHSAHHQALLAEYLASYGYLVCTTPSQSRIGGPMTSEADVLPQAQDQKGDLLVAMRYARETFPAAIARAPLVGTVGHSFGARSGLLLAEAIHASALVSLDGGIGSAQAPGWLDANESFASVGFTTPILHLYETTDAQMTPDLTLLRRLRQSARTLARVDGLRHSDFSSLGFASAAIPGLTGPAPDAIGDKCAAVALYTRMFLDAHLRGKPDARKFLAEPPRDRWLSLERWPAE